MKANYISCTKATPVPLNRVQSSVYNFKRGKELKGMDFFEIKFLLNQKVRLAFCFYQ